jgi:hypothetical protein
MVSWKNSMENQWMILAGEPQLFYQLLEKNLNPQKKTPKGLFYGESILYYNFSIDLIRDFFLFGVRVYSLAILLMISSASKGSESILLFSLSSCIVM